MLVEICWHTFPNMCVYGGKPVNVSSVDDCKQACVVSDGCQGVDWVDIVPNTGCRLIYGGRRDRIMDVTHYELSTQCGKFGEKKYYVDSLIVPKLATVMSRNNSICYLELCLVVT